jgi:hypothetical protein
MDERVTTEKARRRQAEAGCKYQKILMEPAVVAAGGEAECV